MTSPDIFMLPDLGEGLVEADLVQWHVSPGDHVAADQPLVSVETDKAVVEIPAPHAGTIAELFAEEGETVDVGSPLLRYEKGQAEDRGSIVGDALEPSAVQPERAPPKEQKPRIKAAPDARAKAQDLGVDLSSVTPTGPGGVITRADVEATAKAGSFGEPLTGARKAMARKMTLSHSETVPASVHDEADIEAWLADEEPMVRLIRAIVAASAKAPALNVWFDGKRLTRQMHDEVNLGIAVNTPDGLFVPVLHDVGARSPEEIIVELSRLTEAVKRRSITPGEMKGATITLSNFGSLGGTFANMVVVPPQVAIVGSGRTRPVVTERDGHFLTRRTLPLSLTFDHRAVTGGEATEFLNALIEDLSEPD